MPDKLWANKKYDIGLLHVQPVLLKLKPEVVPPYLLQYLLNVSQMDVIWEWLSMYVQVVIKQMRCLNTPLFPVKKKTE